MVAWASHEAGIRDIAHDIPHLFTATGAIGFALTLLSTGHSVSLE